jgi:2-oxoglutarate/2-oxoacid ferredoxin oxidoreductase subunit beta
VFDETVCYSERSEAQPRYLLLDRSATEIAERQRLLMSTYLPVLTKKEFQTDQEIRWCPGCGDYAILAAVQAVFPELGIKRENFVVVSGIGCSSRFPYYMNTFGFHTIHGRAPAVATGLKAIRPDLEVWVATGDGDALSIGGNHTIHMLRRNVGLKVLLFNNRIYGLTKGQYSPTSEIGKKAKSTPYGSLDRPFNPISLAIGAEATFVARSVDVFQVHLKDTLKQAAAHHGSAFVEILQNCNIFNDGAWTGITEKDARSEHVIQLEHGKPLVFGKNRDKGIRRKSDGDIEIVQLGNGISESRRPRRASPTSFLRLLALSHGASRRFPHPDRRPPCLGRSAALRRRHQSADSRRASQTRHWRSRQASPRRRYLASRSPLISHRIVEIWRRSFHNAFSFNQAMHQTLPRCVNLRSFSRAQFYKPVT